MAESKGTVVTRNLVADYLGIGNSEKPDTVSYTHLDVYKRQEHTMRGLCTALECLSELAKIGPLCCSTIKPP